MKGKLIVIEGIDGSGKSTQSKMLCESINNLGYKSIYTFEPTNAYYGTKLRESIKLKNISKEDELNLFVLDRKEHVKHMIKPALEEGYIVVLDRYFYSSIAYQGAYGIDIDYIYKLHKDFIITPDLVFIFTIAIEEALKRIINYRGFTDKFEEKEYLTKVSKIFDSFRESYIYHIDTNIKADALHKKILEIVKPFLERKN